MARKAHIVFILILGFSLVSHFSFSQQKLLGKKVKLEILNGTVNDLLQAIGEEGEFSFSCSNYLIDFEKKVYLDKQKETVRYFLDYIFTASAIDIDYIERDGKIILKPKKSNTKFVTISGTVLDAETAMPVINSSVSVAGTYIGTITDNYGNYTLKMKIDQNGERLYLNYSHVSYESQSRIVNVFDDLVVDVNLDMQIINIEEVEVFGVPRVTFANKDYLIHDYELSGDKILLTVFERRKSKSEMLLISDNQQVLAIKKIPGTPMGTFRDCADDLHLITYYNPYLILVDSSNFYFRSAQQNSVNRINKPCAAMGPDGYYYYYFYGPARISVDYIVYNPETKKEESFRRIVDSVQLAALKDNPDLLDGHTIHTRGAFADLDMGNSQTEDYSFTEGEFNYKPVYAPLFFIKNDICIFNHIDGKIEVYDYSTTYKWSVPISYHHENGWMEKLYFDKAASKVYTAIQEEGVTIVYEIDLRSGKLIRPFKICYKGLEKIQVYNGYIYFLYCPDASSADNTKCMYQQKLY